MKAFAVLCLLASVAAAQPTPTPPGLTRVNHDATMTGDGKNLTPLGTRLAVGGGLQGGGAVSLGLITTCSTGYVLAWSGSTWACTPPGGTGTITSITAGSGLSGGTITSTGTIALAITPTTCTGQFVTAISALGVATCTTVSGTINSLTTGTLPKAGSATTLVDSIISEATGTATVAGALHTTGNFDVASTKLTVNATTGNTVVLGSLTADAGNRVIDAVGSAAITQTANSIDLPTLLTAGSCTSCNLTYDKYGRLTVAANGSGGSITGSGTANTTTKWTGTSAIGNAWALDDATTWGVASKFTITEASGNFRTFGTGTIDGAALLSSTLHTVGAVTFDGNTTLGDANTDTITFTAVAATTLDMNSHKVLNVTNGSSAQDAVAFNQLATAVNAAVSGTTNTIAKFSGANAVGNSLLTDDGTTLKYNTTKFTVASATGNAAFAGTLDITGAATADSGARIVTAAGTGLSKSTNSLAVNIAGASCSAGNHVSAISATGTGTCSADTGSGLSGLTTNAILRAGSSTTAINANETDDGVNFLTTNQVVIAHSGTISYTGLTNQAVFNYDSSTGILTLAGQRTGGLSEIDLATSSSGAATTQLSLTSSAASFTHGVTADGGLRVFTIAGSGLTSVANTVTLNMAGASCSAGSFVSAITATGGTTCTAAGGVISGLTTNAIVKASSSTTIANSSMSDDGSNVTFTENLNGTTANFTSGTTAATFTAYANGSGRTTNVNGLDNENFATYNTTAGALTGYGLQAWSYGTRASGSNNLTNIAVYATASNGQINWDFFGANGNFYQANTGEFAGALTADTTLHVVGAATFDSTVAAAGYSSTGTSAFGGATSITGGSKFGYSGEIINNGTLVTCTSGCTVASAAGGGTGTVTATSTSMTTTFGVAFTNTPTCVLSGQGSGKSFTYTVSTTAITWSSVTSTQKYDFICIGH